MVCPPKIKNIYKKNGYFFNSSFIVFLNGLASVFNYLSSVYINRNLSISDFAQYNAIMNIYTIIILTMSSYGYFIMQNYHKNADIGIKDSMYWTYGYVFSILIFVVYIISIPLINILFNISSYEAMYISSFTILISILTVVSQSILRVNGFIKRDYMANLMSILVMKILLLGYFIITGFTLKRAMISIFMFTLLYFIIHILELKKLKLSNHANIKYIKSYFSIKKLKTILISIMPILTVNFIFNSVIGSDVLMAKRYLDGTGAGYYATMSIIIKMFFYVGTAISAVMYSFLTIAKAQKNRKKEKTVISSSIILLIIISAFLAGFLIIFSKQVILIQFTNRYEALIGLMPKAVIFGFSLSFAVMVFNYCLVYKWYKPFYAYIIMFSLVYISLRNYERTFERFISVFLIFFIVLFVYNAIIFIYHRIIINKKYN